MTSNSFSIHFVFSNLALALSVLIITSGCSRDDIKPKTQDYRDYNFEEPPVTGNTYYIDPLSGSSDSDGSSAHPWRTLQDVIESNLVCYYRHSENNNPESPLEVVNENAPVKGGNRIILKNGYHGYVNCNNFILGKENYSLVYELFVNPDKYDMHLPDNEVTGGAIIDAGDKYSGLVSPEWD